MPETDESNFIDSQNAPNPSAKAIENPKKAAIGRRAIIETNPITAIPATIRSIEARTGINFLSWISLSILKRIFNANDIIKNEAPIRNAAVPIAIIPHLASPANAPNAIIPTIRTAERAIAFIAGAVNTPILAAIPIPTDNSNKEAAINPKARIDFLNDLLSLDEDSETSDIPFINALIKGIIGSESKSGIAINGIIKTDFAKLLIISPKDLNVVAAPSIFLL